MSDIGCSRRYFLPLPWASFAVRRPLTTRRTVRCPPTIAALITANGEPAAGLGGVPVVWHRPRHVAERWVVLRAAQSGALLPVPTGHPAPDAVQDVFRWTEGSVINTATPEVYGYPPCRYHVSWSPGTVIRVEIGDPYGTSGGKGPHLPPTPLTIPSGATQILGTGI